MKQVLFEILSLVQTVGKYYSLVLEYSMEEEVVVVVVANTLVVPSR
jgi:hypothetical protein